MRLRAWALATATTASLLAGCSGTGTDEDASADAGVEQGASAGSAEASAEAEPGAEPQEAEVTAGVETGDLLVHGTVTRDGEPVEGAEVQAVLMPEDLDTLEVGEVVPMWETPSVETGDDGRYAVRLDVEDLDEQYFVPGSEYLNFDLRVREDDQLAEWATTAWRVGEEGVWRSQGAAVADPVIEMSVDLAEGTVAVTDSHGETSEEELAVMDVPQNG